MAYAAINGLRMYYEVHGDGPRCCCSMAVAARCPIGTGEKASATAAAEETVLVDQRAVRVPCRVTDDRHGHNETDEGERESESRQHDDRASPDEHRGHVGAERLEARQYGDDAIGVSIEHHRHRNDADRESQHGEEAADAGVRNQEFEIVERKHLTEETRDTRHLAFIDEREHDQRCPRPDKQDYRQDQCEYADCAGVATPRSKRRRQAWRFTLLAAARKIVETDGEKWSDQEESRDERRDVFVRMAERERDQPAHRREAHAIQRTRQWMHAIVPCTLGKPLEWRRRREHANCRRGDRLRVAVLGQTLPRRSEKRAQRVEHRVG